MAIDTIKFTFVGKSPLMMHSERLVDVLDPEVRELKKLTSTRKKTDDIHAQIARMEWDIGMYHDADAGPIVPTRCLVKTIVGGARLAKAGKDFERWNFMEKDFEPLAYKGPREKAAMWDAGVFADRRSVVVSGKDRVMRCRPIFRDGWSVTFTLGFDTDAINRQQIIDAATAAGKYVGLMELRPQKGGTLGRFEVKTS